MRAVAAAVSAQYRSLSEILCAESRRVLEQMNANGSDDCSDTPIEQIQAWPLVAHCELLCKHEHQAMLTAGRAIRMVQLARLYDVDGYNMSFMSLNTDTPLSPRSPLSEDKSFAEAEEKRRTFWLAYCFDRFCLMRNECPPSLQEELVSGSNEAVQCSAKKADAELTRAVDPHTPSSTRSKLPEQPADADGFCCRSNWVKAQGAIWLVQRLDRYGVLCTKV